MEDLKQQFLEIKSYEEFDRRREEFRDLKFDEEIRKHLGRIFPKAYAPRDKHTDVAIRSSNNPFSSQEK